jgi:predicted anti-sigma-YlaC factor YlaD
MLTTLGRHERGCIRAREWASLRLDGELSELERLFLRHHLGRCPECRAFAGSLAAVAGAIRETPEETPSRSLFPEPAHARPALRFRPRLRARAVALAMLVPAAAGLGIAVGASVWSDTGSPVRSNSGPSVIADLQPENVPVRPRPVGRTANV